MEVCIQTIGWHRLAIPPSLRLFVNGDVAIFNCGENVQRFLNEHKLHLIKIKDIFFTKINPETIGGLVGLLLTLDNISDSLIRIYGPEPIKKIINNFTSSFAKIKNITIEICEISSNASPLVLKGNVLVTPILYTENKVIMKESVNITKDIDKIDYYKHDMNNDNQSCKEKTYSHTNVHKIDPESSTDTCLNNFKKRK